MNCLVTALVIAAGVNALASAGSPCCFHLSAEGGPGGQVGQLSDGQNRIGQSDLPVGQYCIDNNGGLTDGNGRGCILTPPTTQWQCDAGAEPTPGFSVGCNGALMYNNSTTFYSCPTGDHDGYNLYSQTLQGEPGCVEVALTADGCQSDCPKSSSMPEPSQTPTPQPTCPGSLTGSWEFPHLIVQVDSSSPNKCMDSSYNGTVSSDVSSIFNFDIPASDMGKTCNLVFYFPTQSQLTTSAYELTGSGNVAFSWLSAPATKETTYANMASDKSVINTQTLMPGQAYTVTTFQCPAGQKIAFMMSSESGTCLNYFQDYNPCPIGMYITTA